MITLSEINQFNCKLSVSHNIWRLKVKMSYIIFSQVSKTLSYHDAQINLSLKRNGFSIPHAILIKIRVVNIVRKQIVLKIVILLSQEIVFVKKHWNSILNPSQDKSLMSYPAFFTLLNLSFILALYHYIFFMRILTLQALELECSTQIVRTHVPKLHRGQVDTRKTSTANLFNQTFCQFASSLNVVQDITVLSGIVWLLHRWHLNPRFYLLFLDRINLQLGTLFLSKVNSPAISVKLERVKFVQNNILLLESLHRIQLSLNLSEQKLLLVSRLGANIHKHIHNSWIFIVFAKIFLRHLHLLPLQSWNRSLAANV